MEGHERPNDKKKNFFFLKQNKKYQHTPKKKAEGGFFQFLLAIKSWDLKKKKNLPVGASMYEPREGDE
jgi:hypothetical protein